MPPHQPNGLPDEVTCREFAELATDYREGVLDPRTLRGIEQHLGVCDGCLAYLEQMDATRSALGELGRDEPVPESLREELLELVRRRHARGGP